MKTLLRLGVIMIVILSFSNIFAQSSLRRAPGKSASANASMKQVSVNELGIVAETGQHENNSSTPFQPLSPLVSVSNASFTGISGLFDLQSHGRGLHNIQIDPTNPLKIHACAMTTISSDPADTNAQAYPSRRIIYSFSSDGGVTWKTPKNVSGTVRTGYPDMILYKRGTDYVPIIGCHRYAPSSTTLFESAIFIETGASGDGNFKEFDCDRTASDGSTKDLLWPTIALSKDQSKVFIIGDFSNQATASAMDYMEFGSFSLNSDGTTATWDGWKAEPGREDGNTQKGYCQSGKHVIRVADNGTVGIAWINPDAGNGDHNLYFVESTDGGKTWPISFVPLIPAAVDVDNNRAVTANNGLDFFYINNKPHFVWEADVQNYNETDSNGYYFPYTGQVFYWSAGESPGTPPVKCLFYNDALTYNVTNILVNGNKDTTIYLYQSQNFAAASIPTTQTIKLPRYGWVSHTLLAPTSNPSVFAVFYQTISNNDFATETDRDGADQTEWFGNIYFQVTTDGGATWGEPRAYRDNSEGVNQLDYRHPEVSSFSPFKSGVGNFQVMFAADSLPGLFDNATGAGYSYTSWFYQNFAFSSVHSTGVNSSVAKVDQNYPNPFISGTTIPLTMKNDDVVTLSVSDMLGREVAVIYHGRLSAGDHKMPFNAPNLGTGIYTYSLKTSSGNISRTMSLVK